MKALCQSLAAAIVAALLVPIAAAQSGWPAKPIRVGADSWNGLFAPAGTPDDIVQRIAGAAQQAMTDAATRKRMDDIGAAPGGDTPVQFRAFVQAELQKWGNFVKQTGIKIPQ